MNQQAITRVVDAVASQARIILWLQCGHKVSLSDRELVVTRRLPVVGHHWPCHFCPDPEPVAPAPEPGPRIFMWGE